MWLIADVTFDTDSEAREAERLAADGKLAGVSVDSVESPPLLRYGKWTPTVSPSTGSKP